MLVLLILAGATLIWGKSLSGPSDGQTGRNEREHMASMGSSEARETSVMHEFQMFNSAVGT
ncbi:MAG: hypothetical protein JO283_16375, partial [Bradyrhizobium sp.]|nr:hypothetical protein [Bradyrhizobium sp.]